MIFDRVNLFDLCRQVTVITLHWHCRIWWFQFNHSLRRFMLAEENGTCLEQRRNIDKSSLNLSKKTNEDYVITNDKRVKSSIDFTWKDY